jgi:drug/metabolite transporter (DMT)-like permease
MVLAAALLFSTGGAAVKLCTLTGWQVACLRSAIAALVLLILLPDAWRGWSWRTLPVGCAYGATMICFVIASKLTTSANAVFLQSAAPLYVLVLGPLLLAEPIRRRDMLFMAALVVGMVLIFGGHQPQLRTAPDPQLGNAVGAACGIFWSLTIIGLRWLARSAKNTRGNPAAAATLLGNVLAAAIAAPFALPIRHATNGDWAAVAFLGVFQIAVAYVFLIRGMRRVRALEVSLLVLLEPVLNPFWTWLVHGEIPTTRAVAGGAIIICATAVYSLRSTGGSTGLNG